jgi:hypothetical protein
MRHKISTIKFSTGHQSAFGRKISEIDEEDARERYQLEADDNKEQQKASPNGSLSSVEPTKKVISWRRNDPENPYNWSKVRVEYPGFLPRKLITDIFV